MIRRALALALWLAAGPAPAQDLPAVYDVAGVAAGDVLNVRAEPSAGAPVLRTLAPDAKGIEVVALSGDGKWGMVSTGEGNGWVALRYLAARPDPAANTLPRPMTCLGTEPFWLLAHDGGSDSFETPGEEPRLLSISAEMVAPEGYFLLARGSGGDDLYQLTVTRETCSDGMSDRRFGLDARLFIASPDGNRLFRGCCTLEHRD